jgi:putative hydrolase of the HAD superfamily
VIKAIVFDCFGVLCGGSLEYFVEIAPPENKRAVYDVSRSGDYGYISRKEYLKSMGELLDITPQEIDAISKKKHVVNPEMIEFVRLLRKTHKTAMLSNIGHSVMNTIFMPEQLNELFDTVVLSADLGMVKPHPEAYELTATRLSLMPEECIMIDDSVRNVEGAEMTGMKGVLYGSAEQVKADVLRLLSSDGHDA